MRDRESDTEARRLSADRHLVSGARGIDGDLVGGGTERVNLAEEAFEVANTLAKVQEGVCPARRPPSPGGN